MGKFFLPGWVVRKGTERRRMINEDGITEKYTFEQMDEGAKKFVESIQGNELDLGFNGDKALEKIVECLNRVGESFDVSAEDLKFAMNNKGGNQMNNEIEDFVDIRAKLEQLTEECGELAAACMKLIRAIGNGNPCNVTEEQAISKVLEEWSDVEIAAVFMLKMLEDRCDYDIYEKIDKIGEEKTARWQKRVKEALHGKSDEGMDGSSCSDSDSCDI